MFIRQISVFVENKQGKLLDIISLLGRENIDLRAMSIADTADFGVLRLICDDTERAQEVLAAAQCIVTVNEVLGVAVPDSPGGLSAVLSLLAEHDYGIEYIYAFITHANDGAYIILRVEDNEGAAKLLTENGIRLLSPEDVAK